MPIVHIVLFEFKPSVESEVIQDVSLQSWWGSSGVLNYRTPLDSEYIQENDPRSC
jgi:hypothetical protein